MPTAMHMRLRRASRGALVVGVFGAATACSTLFGVDFDNAFPRAPDAASPTIVSNPDGTDSGSPVVPPAVKPDSNGTCAADRKNCDGLCVSLLDPSYGCARASCIPCTIVHGSASCQNGTCANGACSEAPTTCNSPPPPACVNATTRRTYATPGTCNGGSCSYVPSDTSCPNGCSGGNCTCSGLDPSNACMKCAAANCCSEYQACESNTSCQNLLTCVAQCATTDTLCHEDCQYYYSNGVKDITPLNACLGTSCPADCQ